MPTGDTSLTIEEVSPGGIPEWLFEHLINQAIDPRPTSAGGPSNILIIYPNEESRREAMSRISDLGFAFDRNAHHTMKTLKSSLSADLRLPRRIATDPAFEVVLHGACVAAAAELAFPLINPLPEMSWGLGKTKSLAKLHHFLSLEDSLESWEGPGIHSFSGILRDLESRLGGTHPDFVSTRILNNMDNSETPFTLKDFDGMILLDHPPSFSNSHTKLLLALSKICPIHQLTNPGSYRLGHHGFQLQDISTIKSSSEIPHWVPDHEILAIGESGEFERLMLQKEEHSFNAAISIIQEEISKNNSSRVIVVDPSLNDNYSKWVRLLNNIGFPSQERETPVLSTPVGFWLHELCNIGHGTDAFSMERIRSLSMQVSITPFEKINVHPSDSSIAPEVDPALLSSLARSEHLIGGRGALSRWLETLRIPPTSGEIGPAKESAQWWLLSLSNSIKPLLRKEDRDALENADFFVGCHSGEILPIQDAPINADAWINHISKILNGENEIHVDGSSIPPEAVLQKILAEHDALRSLQTVMGQSPPKRGSDWVQEASQVIRALNMPTNPMNSSRLRVMTPEMALGCSSDLLIMANVSSASWKLRVPKFAFLGDSERHAYNLLSPEGPIMDARHYLRHITHCAPRVVILDPSLESSFPAAAPIREITDNSQEEPDVFDNASVTPLGPRDLRQSEGIQLRKMIPPERPPLNPASISIPLDVTLQRDREARHPTISDEDGYLAKSREDYIASVEPVDFTRSTPEGFDPPRSARRWPLVGAITATGKKTPTIDPRPLTLLPSGSMTLDSRQGHFEGPEQDVRMWSASRLQEWASCPRRGWLSSGLRARDDEKQSEDLDQRTHGDLMHEIHYDLLCGVLGMEMGKEREIGDAISGDIPVSLAKSGVSRESLMMSALESLDSRARWLERTDAVSTHWRKVLSGMNHREWTEWLSNPSPIPISGRIGAMISSEYEIPDAMPIAFEWDMYGINKSGIEISIPSQICSPDMEPIPPIQIRGRIDRVDLLPHDELGTIWIDKSGSDTVAPIRIHGTNWKPRRLVAIRDLKTSIGKSPEERHQTGLLDELQLAVYARAWEVCHPGDLVVGAGISLFGHESEHTLEVSEGYFGIMNELEIGTKTNICSSLHRFPDEQGDTSSDQFRAWLAQRLSVALRTAYFASLGRVHPTPSESSCRYCPVSSICDVRMEDDF